MAVSRRQFLKHGTFAAVACAASPLPAWSGQENSVGAAHSQNRVLGKVQGLSRQAFSSVVDSAFKVSLNSGNSQPVWLRLVAVNDLPAIALVNAGIMAVPPPKQTSVVSTIGFMLSFSGGPSEGLPQGSYSFEHDRLGTFPLFIVPAAAGLQSYTAVFNTLNTVIPEPAPTSPLRPRTRTNSAGGSNENDSSGQNNAHGFIGGSSNAGGFGGPGVSGSGRPAQQPMEPLFRDRVESKLPE
jgi:hypothetical protein